MIRFLILKTCEAAILVAIIVGLLFCACSIAPAFGVGISGGLGVDGGVMQYQFQLQKIHLQPQVGPPPVQMGELQDG